MAHVAVYRDFAETMAALALTQKQLAVMELVAGNPGASPIDLANTLGTDRAIGRFLPIYQERERPDAMLGTVIFVAGTIASLGIASILFVYGFQDLVNGSLLNDQAGELLLILVILAPIQALDDVLMNGFAVFSSPRAIFFRRYVLKK